MHVATKVWFRANKQRGMTLWHSWDFRILKRHDYPSQNHSYAHSQCRQSYYEIVRAGRNSDWIARWLPEAEVHIFGVKYVMSHKPSVHINVHTADTPIQNALSNAATPFPGLLAYPPTLAPLQKLTAIHKYLDKQHHKAPASLATFESIAPHRARSRSRLALRTHLGSTRFSSRHLTTIASPSTSA